MHSREVVKLQIEINYPQHISCMNHDLKRMEKRFFCLIIHYTRIIRTLFFTDAKNNIEGKVLENAICKSVEI